MSSLVDWPVYPRLKRAIRSALLRVKLDGNALTQPLRSSQTEAASCRSPIGPP